MSDNSAVRDPLIPAGRPFYPLPNNWLAHPRDYDGGAESLGCVAGFDRVTEYLPAEGSLCPHKGEPTESGR